MKEHMVFSDCSIVSYKDIEQLLKENKELKKQLEIDKNQINYFIEENEKLKSKIINTNSVIEEIADSLAIKENNIFSCYYKVNDLLEENRLLRLDLWQLKNTRRYLEEQIKEYKVFFEHKISFIVLRELLITIREIAEKEFHKPLNEKNCIDCDNSFKLIQDKINEVLE